MCRGMFSSKGSAYYFTSFLFIQLYHVLSQNCIFLPVWKVPCMLSYARESSRYTVIANYMVCSTSLGVK